MLSQDRTRRKLRWRVPKRRTMHYLMGMPHTASVSPYVAGLTCRCPRCGKGRLYSGFLTLKPQCDACGLDFTFIDSGDGPAIFIMLFAGFVVVGAALLVEVAYQPPYWVHAALWLPLIVLTTIGPLRPMKALLIALQYHHKAAEGRLERRERRP